MTANPYPGKFILLAGYDGSGKDTQALRLDKVLLANHPTLKIMRPFPKEPTKSDIGPRIYEILYGRDPEYKLGVNLTDFDFQVKFYIPNRIFHYRDVIIPALENGTNIICNRGLDGSIVYGANTLTQMDALVAIHEDQFALAHVPFIWPDLIVIYDVTPETAMKRLRASGRPLDGFEQEAKARQVTSNYRAFSSRFDNCVLVDAEHDGEEGQKIIFAEARTHIFRTLGL